MRYLILMLKGMAFGLSNIIPGLTGGVVLIMLGIYEEFVDAVGNLVVNRHRWKEYMGFLASLGIGAAVAILALANVMTWLLHTHHVPVKFLFMGLLVGTIPSILRLHGDMRPTVGRILIGIGGLALVVTIREIERQGLHATLIAEPESPSRMLYVLVTSFIAGGANVTPGVSGSYVFLLADTYLLIMEALSALTRLTIRWDVLMPTGAGAVLGIVVFAKLIDTAIRRAPALTYYAILGLVTGSVYGLWPEGWQTEHPLVWILPFAAGVLLLVTLSRRKATASGAAL